MNDPQTLSADRGTPRTTAWACALVFAMALMMRLFSLLQLRGTPVFRFLIGDGEGYDAWARRIAGGQWIGGEVFYQAPLYPYLLGVAYRVLGADPGHARVVQAIGGALACVILLLAGRRYFNSLRAGIVAGAMLAIYPPAIFFDGLIQKSSLDVLLTCLLLALASHLPEAATRWTRIGWCTATGVTLALLALTRENALALLPVMAVWVWWTARSSTRLERGLAIGALALGVAAGLSPAVVHNAAVSGELHLTTAQMGPNLYIGNNPQAVGSYMPMRPGRGTVGAERADATALAQEAMGRTLTPAEVSSYWSHQAWQFIVDHPGRWLLLMGRKVLLVCHAVEVADTDDQYTYAAWSWPLRLGYGMNFGIVLALAVMGCVLAARPIGRAWVIPATAMIYAASVVMFYVVARYRLPLAPPLMLMAGAGVAAFYDGWKTAPRRRRVMAAAGATAVFALTWTPVASIAEERGNGEFGVGYLLLTRGNDPAAAVPHLQRAIAALPTYVEAHKYLGDAVASTKGPTQAAAHYQRATDLSPDYAAAWSALGRAQNETGQPAEAAVSLRRAAGLSPGDSDLRLMWAGALMQMGRESEAAEVMKIAARDFPAAARLHIAAAMLLAASTDNAARDGKLAVALAERGCALMGQADPSSLSVLAAAYAEAGRFADAISAMERALEIAQALPQPNRERFIAIAQQQLDLFRAGKPLRRR